jgi:hypothetical protein
LSKGSKGTIVATNEWMLAWRECRLKKIVYEWWIQHSSQTLGFILRDVCMLYVNAWATGYSGFLPPSLTIQVLYIVCADPFPRRRNPFLQAALSWWFLVISVISKSKIEGIGIGMQARLSFVVMEWISSQGLSLTRLCPEGRNPWEAKMNKMTIEVTKHKHREHRTKRKLGY